MANKVMGYVICGYSSVDNLMSEQSSPFRRWTTGNGIGSSYRHEHRSIYSKQMSEGANQVSVKGGETAAVCAGGGAVSRWSLGLEHLLADPAGAAAFAHFLDKMYAVENIRFWWACEEYSRTSCSERSEAASRVWSRYLADGAPEPVNVNGAARRAAALRLHLQPPPQDLFREAQEHIFNLMKLDSYPRFLKSSEHAECARADLRGLPLPYPAYNNHTDTDSSPTKLKKSASNASERRRSGGSLLPWRLRGASRDRDRGTPTTTPTPTPAPITTTPTPPVTDVKDMGALCRVELPGGATSVVSVERGEPVRALVRRLLHKRDLRCDNYDVLLTDVTQGECATVDCESSSSVLCGRSVRVERRCVLRLELGARCVAVRCRPARRLAHLLPPVLARYQHQHPQHTHQQTHPHRHAVLRAHDGAPVHTDTVVEELDGARLRIVEICESGECTGNSGCETVPGGDNEAATLSELAVRLHEDCTKDADAQSGVSGSSASRSECGSSCGANTNGVGAVARVRTTLHSGTTLHHHPPEFLDNLRETQRTRLQGKASSPLPCPAPRSPPPLPPKPTPAPRPAPTLV